MIWVAELTVKLVALVEPKVTAVAPVKPLPVMTTWLPPDRGPDEGFSAAIEGPANCCTAAAVRTTMATAWALVTEFVGCRYRAAPEEAPVTTLL